MPHWLEILLGAQVLITFFGLLLALAGRWWLHTAQVIHFASPGDGTVTVIIPVLEADAALDRCLKSIVEQHYLGLQRVVVVLQGNTPGQADAIRKLASDDLPLEVVETLLPPSKPGAIRRGLECVFTTNVVLLDSDTQLLSGALSALVAHDPGEVIYGVIVPRFPHQPSWLATTVAMEKAISHGVFRPGRHALGCWPNLSGQCYLAPADLLREVYNEELGYLDDLVVTFRLVAMGKALRFLPRIVAEEDTRETWMGLLLQRARWTIGQVQTASGLLSLPGHRMAALAGWLLHVWLYYGWHLASFATATVCLLGGQSAAAVFVAALHLTGWAVLMWLGQIYLSKLEERLVPVSSPWLAPVAAVVSAGITILGAVLALPLYLARPFTRTRLISLLYLR